MKKLDDYKKGIQNKINPCRTNSIKYALLKTELGLLVHYLNSCEGTRENERILMLKRTMYINECMLFIAERITE